MIQQAQSYHLKPLLDLSYQYYLESPYSKTHTFESDTLLNGLRRAMIVASHELVVVEYDGEVVAGAYAYAAPYVWCSDVRVNMELIYIYPEYRGKGYAEQLLQWVEDWARKLEAREVTAGDIGLTPRQTNIFLKRNGFSDEGVLLRKVLD